VRTYDRGERLAQGADHKGLPRRHLAVRTHEGGLEPLKGAVRDGGVDGQDKTGLEALPEPLDTVFAHDLGPRGQKRLVIGFGRELLARCDD
jgi:hypothetical protein